MKNKIISFYLTVSFLVGVFAPEGKGEQLIRREVDWYAPAGGKIREIRFRAKTESAVEEQLPKALSLSAANVIDSPPIDGFVPWIVITTTNRRLADLELDAVPSTSVVGQFTAANWQRDFAIGIFDTGASAHVLNYAASVELRLNNSAYLTNNTITIAGVTGSVDAYVSYPLGVFMGGLNLLEPNQTPDRETKLPSTAGMVGEYNVSVLVGQYPGSNPDLVTAVGTPMSVFWTTVIRNDQPVTSVHKGQAYTGPSLTFYPAEDENAPHYRNRVPLELRPLGATAVQYIPYSIDDILNMDFTPSSPSVIIGTGSQSLFFVHSVDLTEGGRSAIDRSRFMLDTGAQITVIGDRIAARLGLDPDGWEFQVPIIGVTGETIEAPGYYLDSLKIPAIGQWLEFTNVPVVWLEISSPEGGKLDGVIGMNLFTEYNLILRGGGLFLGEDPSLEFERIVPPLRGDIAPAVRDGRVDMLDMAEFSRTWLSESGQTGWNPAADFSESGRIDLSDLAVLAEQWLAVSSL
ncbi:MAG TPA: aspartyl protease family protein [Anaerohalosphaeraceae bacterium]|nr:aspartyl protease family protein [Anaerohalosphaeraceae bacterium]